MTIQQFGNALKAGIISNEVKKRLRPGHDPATDNFWILQGNPGFQNYAAGNSAEIDDLWNNGHITRANLIDAVGGGTIDDWSSITIIVQIKAGVAAYNNGAIAGAAGAGRAAGGAGAGAGAIPGTLVGDAVYNSLNTTGITAHADVATVNAILNNAGLRAIIGQGDGNMALAIQAGIDAADARFGSLLNQIVGLGWFNIDIHLGGDPLVGGGANNDITVYNPVTNIAVRGIAPIVVAGDKFAIWQNGWDAVGAAAFTGVPVTPRAAADLAGMTPEVVNAWLNRIEELLAQGGATNAPYSVALRNLLNTQLSRANIKNLHLQGWNPSDITLDAAATNIRAFNPVTGADDLGAGANNFAGIEAVASVAGTGKFAIWQNGWDAVGAAAFTGVPVTPRAAADLAGMTPEVVNAWLNRIEELLAQGGATNAPYSVALRNLLNTQLSRANIKNLHLQGWNPSDITLDAAATNIRAFNPVTGADDLGAGANNFAGIEAVASAAGTGKFAIWQNGWDAVGAAAFTGVPVTPRAAADLAGMTPEVVNAWLNRIEELLAQGGATNAPYSVALRNLLNTQLSRANIKNLHLQGWNPSDITLDAAATNIRAFNPVTGADDLGAGANNFAGIEAVASAAGTGKFAIWQNGWDAVGAAAFTGVPVTPRAAADLAGMTPEVVNAWLNRIEELLAQGGATNAPYSVALRNLLNTQLSRANIKNLHLQGWNPSDITLDAAATNIRAFNPVTGADDLGAGANNFAGIEAVASAAGTGKFAIWQNGWDAVGAAVSPSGPGLDRSDTLAGMTPEVVNAWLEAQQRLLSAPGTNPADGPYSANRVLLVNNNFDRTHIKVYHKQGWEPEDFFVNAAGDHIQVINPTTAAVVNDFGGIEPLQGKQTAFRTAVIAHIADPVPPSAAGPYKSALIAADQAIIDSWLTRQETIGLTTRLTAVQCQELHRLGWSPTDITNVGGVAQGADPGNAATPLNGFANIRTVNKFVIADFKTQFRNEALRLHNLGGANANNPAYAQLNTVNTANDFIIDNYNHNDPYRKGLTAVEAVTAYNNNWCYGLEIRVVTDVATQGDALGDKQFTYDGGVNWVKFDWTSPSNKRDTIRVSHAQLGTALSRECFDAYQFVKEGNNNIKIWRPRLRVTDRASIGAAANLSKLKEVIQGINKTRYLESFRNEALRLHNLGGANANNPAYAQLNTVNTANDFIIGQFFDTRLSSTDAVTNYNKNWIYGNELKVKDSGALQYSLDGGKTWKDVPVTATGYASRATVFASLPTGDQNKTTAYQLSNSGDVTSRWNPVLKDNEKKLIRDAADDAALAAAQTTIKARRDFVIAFKAVDATKPSKNATEASILAYCGKSNLTAAQAAALYNGTTQVLGSELTKHASDLDKIMFDGKEYAITDTTGIIAAKKTKNELVDARNSAITEIQDKADELPTDEPNAKKVEDAEIKTELNKATPKPIAHNKSWKDYINDTAVTAPAEVTDRRDKVLVAIAAIRTERKKPTDFNKYWTDTIVPAITSYWDSKLGKGKTEKKIDDKTIDEVLPANWKTKPTDKNTKTELDDYKKILTGKIDTAREKEDESKKVTPAEVKKSVGDKYAPGVEMKPEVVTSYVEKATASPASPFKAPEKVAEFLENAKVDTKKADFVSKVLNKLTGANKVDGTNDDEKFKNFITNKKVDEVIKLAIRFRLEDDKEYLKKARELIKAKEKQSGQELSLAKYTKEGNDYTKAALELFLFEEEDGATHEYVDEKDNKEYREKKNNTENPPWYARWGYAPLWGPVVLISGVALWYYWDKITGPSEEEEDSENASE